jgi:16S rRNA (adenine1518-N6/adenine1519-N6)-dimethyltransferase
MCSEETKQLLRTFRIVPNRLLGQNFMVEPSFYPKLCEYADLSKADVVLDAGAGFGFLTRFLAEKCKAVVAVEKDQRVVAVLREQVKDCANVTVIEGDLLKAELPEFNKVVAIPPYYLSSRLVTWLLERKTERAVLILQKEFAAKLVAPMGSEDYGWLTVVAFHEAQVEPLDLVPKSMFYPQPEVDSVIVRLTRWKTSRFKVEDEEFFSRLVRWLFTQRNKKICNAIVPFLRNARKINKEEAGKLASKVPFGDKRARELSPREFGELANALGD